MHGLLAIIIKRDILSIYGCAKNVPFRSSFLVKFWKVKNPAWNKLLMSTARILKSANKVDYI